MKPKSSTLSLYALFFAAVTSLGCGEGFSNLDPQNTLAQPTADAGPVSPSECSLPPCERICNSPVRFTAVDARTNAGALASSSIEAWRASVALVRVGANTPRCTCTIVGSGYCLTAAHCLSVGAGRTPESECASFEIVPGYFRRGGDQGPLVSTETLRCTGVADYNRTLDFALLRLDRVPANVRPMPVATRNPSPGEEVYIFHNPGGRAQVVSAGTVQVVDATRVLHRCDTEGGSSGASVLNRDGYIVALHVAGSCNPAMPMSSNRAVAITAILAASPTLRAIASEPASCPSGTTRCGAACVDLQTDASHCGGCNQACPTSDGGVAPVCRAGACVPVCATGFGDCDGNALNGCETSLTTNPLHCGACNVQAQLPYVARATCEGGVARVATCAAGRRNCDGVDSNGCEVDVTYDDSNCGACGAACALGSHCFHGACTLASSLCAGAVRCGDGTACAMGMTCVGSGASQRCECRGVPRNCVTNAYAPGATAGVYCQTTPQ